MYNVVNDIRPRLECSDYLWTLQIDRPELGLVTMFINKNTNEVKIKLSQDQGNVYDVDHRSYKTFPGLQDAVTCLVERWRFLHILFEVH